MPLRTSPSTDQGSGPWIAPQRWSDDPDALPAHATAAHLWASGVHQARILAGLVDVPALVTEAQADAWVADLDSWDVCDQLQKLFVTTHFGHDKAIEWARRDETFVKRAGFVLMATIAVHDKAAPGSSADRLPARRRGRGSRWAHLGQEGRQLGAASDRQALAHLSRRGSGGGGADPVAAPGVVRGEVGRARRLARTTQPGGRCAVGCQRPGFATTAVLITLVQP